MGVKPKKASFLSLDSVAGISAAMSCNICFQTPEGFKQFRVTQVFPRRKAVMVVPV